MAEEMRFDSRQGQEIFLIHNVLNGAGGHPVSRTVDVGGSSPGFKAAAEWRWPTFLQCRS
jgi:hypothetical protein